MGENSLIKLACTQMSIEFDKLLLEISSTINNLPANSSTNENTDIVNNNRVDSTVALVDLHSLIATLHNVAMIFRAIYLSYLYLY